MTDMDTVIGACKNVVLDLIIAVDSGAPFQRSSANCSYNLVIQWREVWAIKLSEGFERLW